MKKTACDSVRLISCAQTRIRKPIFAKNSPFSMIHSSAQYPAKPDQCVERKTRKAFSIPILSKIVSALRSANCDAEERRRMTSGIFFKPLSVVQPIKARSKCSRNEVRSAAVKRKSETNSCRRFNCDRARRV